MTIRAFTDGACSLNGRPGAKAGFAVWFPDHRQLSASGRVPEGESQTNQRAEMRGIERAVSALESAGFYDEDIVIYTDSDYCISCLTKWIPGWVARGWKTSEGKDVLHRDLIESIANRLTKFKSHRFHHVRAHTGGGDDLSVNNDIVDRMARATIEDKKPELPPPATDALFEGCPLRLMGAPIPQQDILRWVRSNIDTLDKDVVDKYLFKAFTEICKTKDVVLTKQTLQKRAVIRAERGHLQIDHVETEKTE
jgi:ribonuclease HI